MASIPDPLALTGTLRYPFARLLDLVRLILVDYQSHLQAKDDAADGADDDDAMSVYYHLGDVNEVTWRLDRRRWYAEDEAAKAEAHSNSPESKWKVEALKDPNQAEKALLAMGEQHKAGFVIPAAIKLRREMRSDPPEGCWKNEDALLDLLEFMSGHNHSGLFRAMED